MIKRIIARLDIKNSFLVKGMHLEGLRILGYPELFSRKYFEEGIDEIIFQDVVASLYKRNQLSSLTNKISNNTFVPIIVGGGIRSIQDIKEVLVNGADRVSINTGAIENKNFIREAVKIFGSSTICISIETLKIENNYKIFTDSGRTEINKNTFNWIKEVQDLGVGEIILTSISKEGTGKGYDIKLYEEASKITNVSLLAHGGAKNPSDVYEVFSKADVDGAVIASAFHFSYYKELLDKKDIPLKGSTDFLKKNNNHQILFGINNLKEYLKKKKITIR